MVIFLDLAKAFGTVDHSQLLEDLEDLGVSGNVLGLFRSYLHDREQFVEIEKSLSKKSIIEYGVPQGTVLAPLLFIIYINNILKSQTTGDIISFAGDTAIYYKDISCLNLKNKVEGDMKTIVDCFSQKKLTINFEKTWLLPFACYSSKLPDFEQLEITNSLPTYIKSTKSVKCLGVHIDRHMR